MPQVLNSVLDFLIVWYAHIAAVVLPVGAFFVGRVTKKPVVKEIVVWKKAVEGRRVHSGKVRNILRPVIEKGTESQ